MRGGAEEDEAEYAPRMKGALQRENREFWILLAVVWPFLAGGAYAAGATVAWVRRGFRQ